ncbi:CocE/NonD family hydrolase [Candidatus Poribacteria bacterium]|nr:CocE/NonD family hydrolase [Candidatus Poribacteria bacterium]
MPKFFFALMSLLIFISVSKFCLAEPSQTVMVPMRDGVKLATDIYLPTGDGPWPVILIRTPYNKEGVEAWGGMANLGGYVFVAQDFRGRFGSEGKDYPVFLHGGWSKYQDGYDTVEWIAEQEWCNGKVGGIGMSAPAIDLNMMAPSRPPHLVCIYSVVAYSSMYHQCTYQGGVFRKSLMELWLSGNEFDPKNLEMFRAHPNYDDFWKKFDCESVADRVNVPCLFLGGWYDIFNAGSVNSFTTINNNGDEGARGNCILAMEAYGHGRAEECVQFPDKGRPEIANIGNWMSWFDMWMKNDGKGMEELKPVYYFVMGDPDDKNTPGNQWKSADDWPIPAEMTKAYFHSDGKLSFNPSEESESSLYYDYDPKDPVPTIGGANLVISKGPMDQQSIEDREDVLLFTSDELENYMEITGPLTVKIWALSDAVDTDFTAKLCDVYPDGRSILIADGIIRASHRNTLKKRELMEPGQIYEFEIDLWNTSLVFSPGHRIRVAISSSNSPRFDTNPNTGKLPDEDEKTKVARNTIYMDAEHPSHIILPVVPQ